MPLNGELAIDMGLLYCIRTHSSYSQLHWVMHSIVIVTSLLFGAVKVVIDWHCAIVCQSAMSWTFKSMTQLNARARGVLPSVEAMVTCMACIAVAKA